ncbi:uncharacterized protein PAF06_017428 [Gastrophryne carolinensis]
MFHCFIVREDHRNFLRFVWHRNNNMDDEIMEYRMKVHVFGNSPSPAVATYGLRRTALSGEKEYGTDARHFIERDFYVDDGLKSLPTEEEAIDLLQRTQGMLSEANLRLHKIASNNSSNQTHIGFLFGKAKLAPKPEHTIPRLELCGTVLAVEIADFIMRELDIQIDDTKFYTDSKVVLGYIYNQTKRFYVYVSNRVERIRKSSRPEQWHYVPSEINPADHATRPVSASAFANSSWITGPEFLLDDPDETTTDVFSLLEPDKDPEIRPEVKTLITHTKQGLGLGCHRFERFSKWTRLVRTMARLVHIARCFHTKPTDIQCQGWHMCQKLLSANNIAEGEMIIMRIVQREVFGSEIKCILDKRDIPKNSPIANLNPFIDNDGMLRVGGRLNKAELGGQERNPLIIPARHHITTLLIRHYHEGVKHQENPTILTPATLLTQKLGTVPVPPGNFKSGNLCYDQWKRVQHLANCFWNRWKMEYLSTLQGRRKWQRMNPNIQVGDLVLLKDQQAERIEWPVGLIIKSVPSNDGKVRKVEVKVARQGTVKTFLRPITELILLLPFGE